MEEVIALAACIGVPIALVGPDGVVLYANPSCNKVLGLVPEFDWREQRMSLNDVPAIDPGDFEAALEATIATGESRDCEIYLIDEPLAQVAGRGRNTIPARVSPISRESANSKYLLLLCPKAGPAQRDEAELLRIQRGENLERLASGVAHEFNNLFTGIKGMTDLIKTEASRESEIYEFAETIKETVNRGSRLIQQLSNFARDEPYSLIPTDIGEYLARSRPLLELQLERGTRFEVDVRQSGPVMLDTGRMDQALANLLHNSRDAVGGKGRVRITVDRRQPDLVAGEAVDVEHTWMLIEVADSGPGIDEKLLPRVVEPFFTTKERGKATGLGLSTTTKIVEMHGGVMAVGRSEELGGASVRIFLPLAEFSR